MNLHNEFGDKVKVEIASLIKRGGGYAFLIRRKLELRFLRSNSKIGESYLLPDSPFFCLPVPEAAAGLEPMTLGL